MNNKIKYLQEELTFDVSGQKLFEISKEINSWINSQKINLGHLMVFIKHTTASIIIQENYSNDVLEDIQSFFHKLVPEDNSLYKHSDEGKDDMPAHIKSLLTQTSVTVPVLNGKMDLGVWQGIFLYEHKTSNNERKLKLTLIGN